MRVAIIGGGAAGIFCAANIRAPGAEAVVLESGARPLRKVLASGGGRCNITNAESDISKFISAYPRGGGRLRKPLLCFGPKDTLEWFGARGAAFETEGEGRVFPKSGGSAGIAAILERARRESGAEMRLGFSASSISRLPGGGFEISSESGESVRCDAALFATGGSWHPGLRECLERMGHAFEEPAPSLFAFKIPGGGFSELAGTPLRGVSVSCREFKISATGDVLPTHEGLSGPGILRLSSLGARLFRDAGYRFRITLGLLGPGEFRDFCSSARAGAAKKLVKNFRPQGVPQKWWDLIVSRAGIDPAAEWAHFSRDGERRLAEEATALGASVCGRASGSGEFVTCGGVALGGVDFKTMQSRHAPGIYFAGECLDIDAFTGGYNLQAAWTTGMTAAMAISKAAAEGSGRATCARPL